MKAIELKSTIIRDEFVDFVVENYDIQNANESITRIENNIKLPEQWNIGVIYGGSGTGKSTLLKTFGQLHEIEFDRELPLISNFNFVTPQQACELLTSIGLASVPAWLRPFGTLSNGEQDRAKLAMAIGRASNDEIVLIDEFTSVVDRDVAKAMSVSLSKYIRRHNKQIILASCHFDIMDWLLPDWIYSPNKGRVEIRDCLCRRRPNIKLSIFRCKYETWNLFKRHHYLTDELNKAAKCFLIMWNDKPIAFVGVLPFPHGSLKNAFRISRLVVLPDFQGLGVGFAVLNYVCSLYKSIGCRMFIKTSNPGLGEKLVSSPNQWRETSQSRKEFDEKTIAKLNQGNMWGMKSQKMFYSTEYIGTAATDSTDVLTFNADAWVDVAQNQISMFDVVGF
jgi:ABC-type lipoprotein export system ATPase subunit/GNAT superfamily N-acetyltransferase